MTFLKRTLCLFCICLVWCSVTAVVFAGWPVIKGENPYTNLSDDGTATEVAVVGTDKAQEDALVNVIKWWVNWVLGILALIALVILMYGWFLMVTAAGNEERYGKGRTILKQAALGLFLIGLAWFVISIIFWLVNVTSEWVWWAGTDT